MDRTIIGLVTLGMLVPDIIGMSVLRDDRMSSDHRNTRIAHTSQDWKYALDYLVQYGYMRKIEDRELRKADDFRRALQRFQAFAKIKVTGRLDNSTVAKMKSARCGVVDGQRMMMTNKKRRRRFVLMGNWGKNTITYRFRNFTSDMFIEDQRREITRAFRVWSKNTPLSFQEDPSENADIAISFYRGRHDDGYPFDGNGKTLAHAFFPGQGKRSGEAHFDEDEKWTSDHDEAKGTNLFMVATHELGHALGLGHSSKLDSVMLPFYQGYIENVQLGSDDRHAVQLLYGGPLAMTNKDSLVGNKPEPRLLPTGADNGKPPGKEGLASSGIRPPQDPNMADLCTYEFDAVANIRSEMFFIKDENFWRIDSNGVLQNKHPSRMSSFWTNFPDARVDAAFTRPSDQAIIFISGNEYWLYHDNNIDLDPQSPRPITDFDLDGEEKVDAACVWSANQNYVYFFKGRNYWKHDKDLKATVFGYPREISDLGLPDNLDAAVLGLDGKTYFFKGNQYWMLDDDLLTVSPGYPKYIGPEWFGCEPPEKASSTTEANNSTKGGGGNGSVRGLGGGYIYVTNLVFFLMSTHISIRIMLTS